VFVAQLLVRDLDASLVRKLKLRAAAHGVSAEEEHRRILKEALFRPEAARPSLVEFLISQEGECAPGCELEISRSREIEDRDTGL
jgi:plasmid stability protein